MSLSPEEAADALRNISQTGRRSFSAYGYQSAAPFLILWGLLWIVGYGGTDLLSRYAGAIWLGVAVFGTVASTLIGMRMRPKTSPRFDWRIFGTWLAVLGFVGAMLSIVGPVTGTQVGALIPLLIGFAYIVMGIWMGVRFTFAGLAIVALTLGGYFFLPAHFLLWMAVVGGGTLFATGLWLRTV